MYMQCQIAAKDMQTHEYADPILVIKMKSNKKIKGKKRKYRYRARKSVFGRIQYPPVIIRKYNEGNYCFASPFQNCNAKHRTFGI